MLSLTENCPCQSVSYPEKCLPAIKQSKFDNWLKITTSPPSIPTIWMDIWSGAITWTQVTPSLKHRENSSTGKFRPQSKDCKYQTL